MEYAPSCGVEGPTVKAAGTNNSNDVTAAMAHRAACLGIILLFNLFEIFISIVPFVAASG
jgi:hypothetical protein